MDSKQLYNAAEHLSSVVTWDNEWIHFGTGEEIKENLIVDLVDSFLVDESLNLVHDRQDSGRHKKVEVMREMRNLLGQESFQLWDANLTKVIKFDRIGVLKLGRK